MCLTLAPPAFAGKGKIDFVDIAAPNYEPSANAGITFEQVGAAPRHQGCARG